MGSRRGSREGPAWGGSAVPALAGLDGRYVERVDLAPMVSVVLVLLIVFFVLTPSFTTWWNYPRAATAAVMDRRHLVLSMDWRGATYLEGLGHAVEARDLPGVLRSRLAATAEPEEIYLRAPDVVPYSAVLNAMDAMRAAGVHRVGLLAEGPRPRKHRSAAEANVR